MKRQNVAGVVLLILALIAGRVAAADKAETNPPPVKKDSPAAAGAEKAAPDPRVELAALEKKLAAEPKNEETLRALIPLYHRLNRAADAEATVKKLRALEPKEPSFVREEFEADDACGGSKPAKRRVRAVEYLRPVAGNTSSNWPVYFEFSVFTDKHEMIRNVFVEESVATTEATGKKTFSLDENQLADGRFVYHAAYGNMMDALPMYAALKPKVLVLLGGKATPRSSTGEIAKPYAEAGGKTPEPAIRVRRDK